METLEPRRLLSLSALGPEVLIDSNDPAEIDVGVGLDGSSVIAASYHPTELTTTIVARRYDADGNLIDETTVASPRFGDSVSVATFGDGDAVIAYESFEDDVNALYFVRLSSEGAVSAPVKIAEGSATDPDMTVGQVRVAPGFEDHFYLGYIKDVSRDRHEVRMRYYNGDGVLQEQEWLGGSFNSPASYVWEFDMDSMGGAAHYSAIFVHSNSQTASAYYGFASHNSFGGSATRIADLPGPSVSEHDASARIAAESAGATLVYDNEDG